MPRTTLNIERPILTDLERLQKQERQSLGKLVSDHLAQALAASKSGCRALSVRSSRAFIGRDGMCSTIDEGGDG
jgi:hypothetical protein